MALKKKSENQTGDGIGITALVGILRGDEKPLKNETSKNEESEESKIVMPKVADMSLKKNVAENDQTKSRVDSPLADVILKLNEKDYNCKELIYIDKDVKTVFQELKSKGKIQIAPLISLILEDWIINNSEAIQTIIRGKNKYL